ATCLVILVPFFFSSRRLHTRFSRDWSSDVYSSDLHCAPARGRDDPAATAAPLGSTRPGTRRSPANPTPAPARSAAPAPCRWGNKIGRASCRERVGIEVVDVPVIYNERLHGGSVVGD